MTDVLTRLREANPVRSEDLAPSIKGVWDRLADPALRERPDGNWWSFPTRSHRGIWRRFVILAAGSVAALIAVLVFGTAGGGPSSAFAGWTAQPTMAVPAETAGALGRCTSALAAAGGPSSGIPADGWKPLLTDTRGPFTALILRSGGTSVTCLTGPSFTSTFANATQTDGASQHTLSMSTATGQSAPSVSVLGLGGNSSGPISTASQLQMSTSAGQPYTLVQGQIDQGVTGVTLALADGSTVRATVGDGSFIAWWPGSAAATSAQLTSASGASTQQLTFTPVPVPTTPSGHASRSAPSSP